MNVLSLFDGMSCGQLALRKAGIEYDSYYASEVDADAIQVAMRNFPKTIQLGDVRNIKASDLPPIDLLIGGSPCQDFSNVKIVGGVVKQALGLDGEKSRLFYEYLRLFTELKPRWFLLENIGSMKKEYVRIIDQLMGVEGIKICSSRFVPQIRNRIYWTNILYNSFPRKECGQTVFDLLEPKVDDKYFLTEKMKSCVMSVNDKWTHKPRTDLPVAVPLTATMHKMHRAGIDNYYTFKDHPSDKSDLRRLTPVECERLQGAPDGYTAGVSDTQRYRMLGNGWTVDVIAHILKGIEREKDYAAEQDKPWF